MDTCEECGGQLTVMESWITVGDKPAEKRGEVGVCDDCGNRYLRAQEGEPWRLEGAIDPPG